MSGFKLVSDAEVHCYAVRAEIKVFEKLDYIIPVLMHMQDVKNATPDSVADELFLKPTLLGEKLLEMCREKGLAKRSGDAYNITAQGKKSIAEQTIPTKIDGMWIIYYVDHPIIPDDEKILYIKTNSRKNPINRQHAERTYNQILEKSDIRMHPIPSDGINSFEIIDVDEYIWEYDPIPTSLVWHVGKTTSKIEMTVTIDHKSLTQEFEPGGLKYEDVCDGLFDRSWDVENNRLLVYYDELREDEHMTMRRNIDLARHLGGAEWRIKHVVNLHPKDESTAQRWASFILADQAAKHAVQKYDEMCKYAQNIFPEFSIKLKDKDDLAQDIRDACDRDRYY